MSLPAPAVAHIGSEGPTSNSHKGSVRYPLLEALLEQKGLRLLGIYRVEDAPRIFGVSVRTIQERVRDGKLIARDLPGRGRFLSEDLEIFLQESVRKNHGAKAYSFDETVRGRPLVPIGQRKKRRLRK